MSRLQGVDGVAFAFLSVSHNSAHMDCELCEHRGPPGKGNSILVFLCFYPSLSIIQQDFHSPFAVLLAQQSASPPH